MENCSKAFLYLYDGGY